MGWKETDERLIRRGELILDIESLKNHRQELKKMNKGKRGRSYRIANSYVQLLAAIRYLYQMPYRQLEGYTRILHRLVPAFPPADYSGLRKRILRLSVDPYRNLKETSEPVTIAVDSTGISVQKAGGWIERKHGKKKRYVKPLRRKHRDPRGGRDGDIHRQRPRARMGEVADAIHPSKTEEPSTGIETHPRTTIREAGSHHPPVQSQNTGKNTLKNHYTQIIEFARARAIEESHLWFIVSNVFFG